VKALKEFRTYILHSHVIACVPNSSVKDILTQPDPEGRRGKWIAAMLEYDLEIKPTKLIKGQGLTKLMVQSDCDAVGMNFIADLSECPQEEKTMRRCLNNSLIHHGMQTSSMCWRIFRPLWA
jgi:hypothetical protein